MRYLPLLLLAACHHGPVVECPVCPAPPPAAECPEVAEAPPQQPTPRARPVRLVHRAQPNHFALMIEGDDANEDKRHRCRDQVTIAGAEIDPRSPIVAHLVLSSQNRLEIHSALRGNVVHEALGPWMIPELCNEVVQRARYEIERERRVEDRRSPPGDRTAALERTLP